MCSLGGGLRSLSALVSNWIYFAIIHTEWLLGGMSDTDVSPWGSLLPNFENFSMQHHTDM